MADINLSVLAQLRAKQASMARYTRERIGEKPAQNAAMVAAGLKPLHDERSLKWDVEAAAEYERAVEALDAVLEHFGADQAEAA